MSRPSTAHYIELNELRVGLHVHLDLSWMEHPFPSSSFKIKNQSQIDTIRGLKLTRVRYSPELSDAAEPAVDAATSAAPSPAVRPTDTAAAAPQPQTPTTIARRRQAARLAERQSLLKTCEQELGQAAKTLKSISRNLYAAPAEARRVAKELIDGLAATLSEDADVAIHLMSDKGGSESLYHHALNVSFLAMMLAREMKAPPAAVAHVGLGALMHDIGKLDIPERVWRKLEPLTQAEQSWVRQHPAGGLALGQRMELPPEALQIISQHHEMVDGSGYPKKLKGTQISLFARIVTVANTYDNLCNPINPAMALTPYEALAAMYGLQRGRFDARALETFVRCMGVYPPGTLVSLCDNTVGMIVKTNASQPLKPTVLVYDRDVPRSEAVMIDLDEAPELSISRALKPGELSKEALAYLAPRQRMTYFVGKEPQAVALQYS